MVVQQSELQMPQPCGLSFADLREANVRRLPHFRNRRGRLAHSKSDGSDWSLAQWCNAVVGELGESANIIKKVDRGDLTMEEARPLLADELADVQTYLDLLAFRAGIDLGVAVVDKFNQVSDRVGYLGKLEPTAVAGVGNEPALVAKIRVLRQALRKHVHTDKCFKYCARTASTHGNAHCIEECSESHREALVAAELPAGCE